MRTNMATIIITTTTTIMIIIRTTIMIIIMNTHKATVMCPKVMSRSAA